jgi:DNA-binding LytR/AlgR family response regulator
MEVEGFFINHSGKLIQLFSQDILFVEVEGDHCKIVTNDEEYLVKTSMRQLKELIQINMIQIHRNYMVKSSAISSINLQDKVVEINGLELPVSRRYKQNLLECIKKI